LQKLKEKAAFRNPDEFYFKMINSRTVGGIHRPKYVQCSPSDPINSSIVRFGLPWVLVLTVSCISGLKIISILKRNFFC
jgi:hypothetical protein